MFLCRSCFCASLVPPSHLLFLFLPVSCVCFLLMVVVLLLVVVCFHARECKVERYSPADCRGTTCIAWWSQFLLTRESSVKELLSMEIRDAIARMEAINLFSSLSPTPGFAPPLNSTSHTSASSDTEMSKLNSPQEKGPAGPLEALQGLLNTVPGGNGTLLRVKPKVAQRSAPPRAVQKEEVSTSPQPQPQQSWTSPPPSRVSVGERVLEGSVARQVSETCLLASSSAVSSALPCN